MTTYVFNATTSTRHLTSRRGELVSVDGAKLRVRTLDGNSFVTDVKGRPTHIRSVAHGDTIHLHLNGRSCIVNRVDPTTGGASAASEAGGGAIAPMPGVVIAWLVQPGAQVQSGDALLVIESMKLQMTISAPHAGLMEEMPVKEGQTFQRGAVLARVRLEGASA